MPDKPMQVTTTNWNDLQAQGFKWKENFDNWDEYRVTVGEWIHKQNEILGDGNVLVGLPANEHGVPDDTLANSDNMVGIYTRSS